VRLILSGYIEILHFYRTLSKGLRYILLVYSSSMIYRNWQCRHVVCAWHFSLNAKDSQVMTFCQFSRADNWSISRRWWTLAADDTKVCLERQTRD